METTSEVGTTESVVRNSHSIGKRASGKPSRFTFVTVLAALICSPEIRAASGTSGEIWDPVANSWSPIAAYPNQSTGACGRVPVRSNAAITAGPDVITGIYSTDRLQVGWDVTGPGIPGGTAVTSVDSLTQVHV